MLFSVFELIYLLVVVYTGRSNLSFPCVCLFMFPSFKTQLVEQVQVGDSATYVLPSRPIKYAFVWPKSQTIQCFL